jgi:hypothetical protein
MIKFLDGLFAVTRFLANLCTVGVTTSRLVEWIRSKMKK